MHPFLMSLDAIVPPFKAFQFPVARGEKALASSVGKFARPEESINKGVLGMQQTISKLSLSLLPQGRKGLLKSFSNFVYVISTEGDLNIALPKNFHPNPSL